MQIQLAETLDLPVDLIVRAPDSTDPIARIAKNEGIPLRPHFLKNLSVQHRNSSLGMTIWCNFVKQHMGFDGAMLAKVGAGETARDFVITD